ncbi:hypothetical protein ACQP31_04965 [Actinobacillus pleuropneumoniae]|uniref:Uncharacterized protein orf-VI1 n=1 Tax=Actinobacillus pleuropneumoniae TaxID=715 RepID=Q9ZIQ3_ACTPL|nr:hypothetical protein [Actinobacillus pleuropneumoniae]AAD01697.1 unknown protein [Actinobacillus pleuropneumoniae serovar 1 str. 4074]ASU14818.1 hypothetical protein CHY23_00001 [Actinobacillus pleuropneumoniae]AWG95433.1 hypothetical protein APPSER1_05485 [Actinobacillus pleuropneumoniae serovar 1 str. 4074]AXA21504.1 hypothetical protein DRF63_05480 [Actinobacillus pleuropneumoniae]EFM89790.1 hypothetical protein appser4_10290 [Actinobacillus pleuropneumoniae serovar 4 str. M62]
MKIKKRYIALLVLGVVISYAWYQNYQWEQLMLSGYCEKDGSYFDDRHTKQELIDRAINYMLEHQSKKTYDAYTDEPLEIKPYLTIEEFKKLNPNCCEITSWPADAVPQDWDVRVEGKAYRYVIVKYLRTLANREPERWETSIVFDNCGNPKRASYLY